MRAWRMLPNSTNGTSPLDFVKCLNIYYLTSAPNGPTLATYLAVTSILSVLSIVTSLGNGLVIYVYFKQKSLQHSNILLLICLAFLDFFTGALLEPLYTIRLLSEIFGFSSCVYILVVRRLFEFLRPVSFITLALITIERYLALFRPVIHRRIVTKRRIMFTVLCSWFVWFLLILVRSFYPSTTLTFYATSTFIVIALLVVNVGMYFKIGKLARFHGKSVRPNVTWAHSNQVNIHPRTKLGVQPEDEHNQIEDKSTRQSSQLDTPPQNSFGEPTETNSKPQASITRAKTSRVGDVAANVVSEHEIKSDTSKKAVNREKYATWTVFYVVFALTMCYLPESVLLVYVSLHLDELDSDLLFIYVPISETIVMFNALINPFIYCLRNRKMRAAVKRCCRVTSNDARPVARRPGGAGQNSQLEDKIKKQESKV